MELLAIVRLIFSVIGGIITILTGILLIRHRQVIEYAKGFFSFIRDDFQAEHEVQYGAVWTDLLKTITYGFKALGKSSSQDGFGDDKANEVNQLLVLLGKLIIVSGILAIISITIATVWMISESKISINLD